MKKLFITVKKSSLTIIQDDHCLFGIDGPIANLMEQFLEGLGVVPLSGGPLELSLLVGDQALNGDAFAPFRGKMQKMGILLAYPSPEFLVPGVGGALVAGPDLPAVPPKAEEVDAELFLKGEELLVGVDVVDVVGRDDVGDLQLLVPVRQRPVRDHDALLPLDGGDTLRQGQGAPLLRLAEHPGLDGVQLDPPRPSLPCGFLWPCKSLAVLLVPGEDAVGGLGPGDAGEIASPLDRGPVV